MNEKLHKLSAHAHTIWTHNPNIVNGNIDITYPHFQTMGTPLVLPDRMFFLGSPCKELNTSLKEK